MNSKGDRLAFLDHVRALAIIFVFLSHSSSAAFLMVNSDISSLLSAPNPLFSCVTRLLFNLGEAGVAIFFVVSGFCIHLSHERSKDKRLGTFFLRRFFRIYPPYLLALLVFTVFAFTKLKFHLSEHNLAPESSSALSMDMITHLFLVHNLSGIYFGGNINASFWSIAVEFQLYLIYPLLLWMARKQSWSQILWITGCIEIGLRTLWGVVLLLHPGLPVPGWYNTPFTYWFSWSLGAVLAQAYLKGKPSFYSPYLLFLWMALVFCSNCYAPLNEYAFTFAALFAAQLVAYFLQPANITQSLSPDTGIFYRSLTLIGVVSYSIYLVHQPLVIIVARTAQKHFTGHHLTNLYVGAITFLSFIPIVLLSYFLYRVIELPSIALGKRLIALQKAQPASAAIAVSPAAES